MGSLLKNHLFSSTSWLPLFVVCNHSLSWFPILSFKSFFSHFKESGARGEEARGYDVSAFCSDAILESGLRHKWTGLVNSSLRKRSGEACDANGGSRENEEVLAEKARVLGAVRGSDPNAD